jgi:hypothetical protein
LSYFAGLSCNTGIDLYPSFKLQIKQLTFRAIFEEKYFQFVGLKGHEEIQDVKKLLLRFAAGLFPINVSHFGPCDHHGEHHSNFRTFFFFFFTLKPGSHSSSANLHRFNVNLSWSLLLKFPKKLYVVACICNPSIWKAEAGRLQDIGRACLNQKKRKSGLIP